MSVIFENFGTAFFGILLTILLIIVGLYVSVRIGFIQIRWYRHIFGYTFAKLFRSTGKTGNALSPLQALSTALAGTIGTGNIAGVAGAIAIGGPGAVFWMWVAAIIGMGTKYAEIVLAVYYREKNTKGEFVGGPMYYIKNGLPEKFHILGRLFSLFGCMAALGIGNMTQANTVANSVATAFPFVDSSILKLITAFILTILIGFVLLGGVSRVGKITERVVPTMAAIYILGTLAVIVANADKIIPTLALIVTAAFNPQSVLGAASGITFVQAIRFGVGRGIFSNEAGLGSAPIAHAASEIDSPVKQGFFGVIEVFVDTVVICTLTALTILITDLPIGYGNDMGIELTAAAFSNFYGEIAPIILSIAVSLFAFTSMISWSLYGARCFESLFGTRKVKLYNLLFLSVILPAALLNIGIVWSIAETLNGLMAIPNIIAIILLCNKVASLTSKYNAGEKHVK